MGGFRDEVVAVAAELDQDSRRFTIGGDEIGNQEWVFEDTLAKLRDIFTPLGDLFHKRTDGDLVSCALGDIDGRDRDDAMDVRCSFELFGYLRDVSEDVGTEDIVGEEGHDGELIRLKALQEGVVG